MISINPAITLLHEAYNRAMGLDLPMTPTRERWWFEADQAGMTPDDVALCIKDRLKIKRTGGMAKGLELRHICGDEVRIDELLVEVAVLRANARIKVMEAGKAQVLRQSGRTDQIQPTDAKVAGALLEQLRQAAL